MFEVPISISVHSQFQLTLPSSPRAATTSHGDARSGRPKQSLKASSVAGNLQTNQQLTIYVAKYCKKLEKCLGNWGCLITVG